jgi:Ca2+:H+ antiporter
MQHPNGSVDPNETSPLLPRHGPIRSGVTREPHTWLNLPQHIVRITYATLVTNYVNWLLIFVPLGILAGELGWGPPAVFILNFIAIVPLASLLSFATEELSAKLGETLGGLLNATFGNAVELIVRLTQVPVAPASVG